MRSKMDKTERRNTISTTVYGNLKHASLKNGWENQKENQKWMRNQQCDQPIGSNQHVYNTSPNNSRICIIFKYPQITSTQKIK